MTELELRALVRDAIARHTGASPSAGPSDFRGLGPPDPRAFQPSHHASHTLFMVPTGADAGGPCVIEPTVPCNHCGYCRSYGH
jgi:hypothetical protein